MVRKSLLKASVMGTHAWTAPHAVRQEHPKGEDRLVTGRASESSLLMTL